MAEPNRVTLLLTGSVGSGKSLLGNVLLSCDPFPDNPSPVSVASKTVSAEFHTENTIRCVIEACGLTGIECEDVTRIQDIVQFLRSYAHGINAFVLVINGQSDRLNTSITRLLGILNGVFDDTSFWNNVCIVFTKVTDPTSRSAQAKETEYRSHVLALIHELQRPSATSAALPVFFVDSKAANNPDVYDLIWEFAAAQPAIPTYGFGTPYPGPWTVRLERRARHLVGTRDEGNRRIRSYEDQERDVRTSYDGQTVTYGEWTTKNAWEETQVRSERRETAVTSVEETRHSRERVETGPSPWFWPFGLRPQKVVKNPDVVTRRITTSERTISTGFDGTVSYGDWRKLRTLEE
jgi:hypothetical protein